MNGAMVQDLNLLVPLLPFHIFCNAGSRSKAMVGVVRSIRDGHRVEIGREIQHSSGGRYGAAAGKLRQGYKVSKTS